jgi:hypothetical protein
MLTTPLFQMFLKHTRYVGLGAMLAFVPVAGRASIVTESINFTVDGADGQVTFTVDTNPGDLSHATSDSAGAYADPTHGLLSLSMVYNGVPYSESDFLDFNFLPIVLLPGNHKLAAGLDYELIGTVVVSGTCTPVAAGSFNCTGPGPGNSATVLGLSPIIEAAVVGGVLSVDALVAGSSTTVPSFGNSLDRHFGSITSESTVPEPGLAPVSAAALAGLWFFRRRKATKA